MTTLPASISTGSPNATFLFIDDLTDELTNQNLKQRDHRRVRELGKIAQRISNRFHQNRETNPSRPLHVFCH